MQLSGAHSIELVPCTCPELHEDDQLFSGKVQALEIKGL